MRERNDSASETIWEGFRTLYPEDSSSVKIDSSARKVQKSTTTVVIIKAGLTWQAFLRRLLISQSFEAGQVYSMLPEMKEKESQLNDINLFRSWKKLRLVPCSKGSLITVDSRYNDFFRV